jgi:RNA polymerase sigma-B factor
VPRDLQELAVRVERETEALATRLGRAPTLGEVAHHMEIATEQVLEAREAAGAYRAVSLDRPRDDEDEDVGMGESMGVEDPGFDHAEHVATIERLLDVLSDREREVLRLRFAEDLTQAEIGERIGVSQMQVSRLLRRALNKLLAAVQGRPGQDSARQAA